MNKKELAEIAFRYVNNHYSSEDLPHGIDLYYATEEEIETCIDLYDECKEIGTTAFHEKYITQTTKEMSASEALCGFVGWLTTRDEEVLLSSTCDCAIIANLVRDFCVANNLTEPTVDWGKKLVHPIAQKSL